MKPKENRSDCGVVIGRFHVNELHEAHIDLIQSVIERHDHVFVFLGNSLIRNTFNNPLDYRSRRIMIEQKFPTVDVHYINDIPDDDTKWSRNLDKLISDLLLPIQTVTLYGSRDSFLRGYTGKYKTCELEATTFVSGTEVRRRVCNNYPATADYRAGMIAATAHRFPTAFQTVDVAVVNDRGELLIARKPDSTKWRFIGGFSDPSSTSLEMDAIREVKEEARIEVGDIKYLGSTLIDDPRYRYEVDKIKTALFVAKYIFGKPEGADDIAEVKWVSIEKFNKNEIDKPHHVLIDMFMNLFVSDKGLYETYVTTKQDATLP